jgi:GT2 family glycosyltransferase
MVSIITVNFNQNNHTFALLDSIRKQDYRQVEVLVVDNGSQENPEALIQTRYPEVKFIRSEQNLGFAGGNNLALPHASGEYLFFVNNDAEITEGCMAALIKLLEATPQAGIVSPLICYHPSQSLSAERLHVQYAGMPRVNPVTGRSKMEGNGDIHTGQYAAPFKTGYAHGAAMMLPKKVLEQIGPMSEAYFLYYEEVDWCERMHRAGLSVWVEPRALVLHKESMTMKELGEQKTFYMSRNRVLFMRRNYQGWHFAVYLLFLTFVTAPKQVLTYLLAGDWKNLRAYVRGICSNFTNK